jgi:restriction system protein
MARRRSARRRREARLLAVWAVLAVLAVTLSVIAWLLVHPLALVLVAGLGGAGIWARRRNSQRRHAAADQQRRRELYERSFLETADVMSGTQFEEYVAGLLALDGCGDVRIVGGPGDGGADILAAEPSGRHVAIQCKRQMAPVPVSVVRQLIGSVSHEHPGRHGMLVTTAQLTGPAADLAARAGIVVVDRGNLARWMASSRQRMDQAAQLR